MPLLPRPNLSSMKTGAAPARAFERFRWIAILTPAVFLIAFHAVLLLRRLGDASITRPSVLGRWTFAIILLVAASIARRFFSGRRVAIAFWLLVAVLHLAIPVADRSVEDVALLVAALPALIVLSAYTGNAQGDAWPASRLIRNDRIAFASLRLDPFNAGRAPPLF